MQETEQEHLNVGAESSESARSTVVVLSFLENVATLLTARVGECRMLWWLGEKSARASSTVSEESLFMAYNTMHTHLQT